MAKIPLLQRARGRRIIRAATCALLVAGTAGCGSQADQDAQRHALSAEQHAAIVKAMCGTASDRAEGLAKVARWVADNGGDAVDVSEDIYDQASDIADEGCART